MMMLYGKISVRALNLLGSFKCRLQRAVECAESGRPPASLLSLPFGEQHLHNGGDTLQRKRKPKAHPGLTCRCPRIVLMSCSSCLCVQPWPHCQHVPRSLMPLFSPPRPAPCNCSYSLPLVSGSCLHCRPFGSSCGASPPPRTEMNMNCTAWPDQQKRFSF